MNPAQNILLTIIPFILVFPGVLIANSLFRRRSRSEVFFIGVIIGLVVLIYVCRLLPFKLFPIILGLEYVGAIYLVLKNKMRQRAAIEPRAVDDPLIWILSIATFILWRGPATAGILPLGVDPMFHSLIAGKILATGHIPTDWLPFESIPLNYPTGSHLWIAMNSWISGAAPHVAFKAVYPTMAFMTVGFLYLLGKEFFGNRFAALFGALLWTTFANWGGLDYMEWGGVPNMMGMLLLLAAIWATVAESGPKRWGLIGLCGAGLLLIHHHAAMVAAAVFIAMVAADFIAEKKLGDRAKDIIKGGILAVCLMPITIFGNLWKFISGNALKTSTFTFPEFFIPIHDFPLELGITVTILGTAGLVYILVRMRDIKDILIPAWSMALLLLLAVFGYLYRAFAFGLYGEFYAAFTPSRFLTDMIYPLCLAAGYFLGDTQGRPKPRAAIIGTAFIAFMVINYRSYPVVLTKQIFLWNNKPLLDAMVVSTLSTIASIAFLMSGNRKYMKYIAAIVLVLIMGAVGVHKVTKISNRTAQAISLQDLSDMNAFRTIVPPDALIINRPMVPGRDGVTYGWLPYWTGRECVSTPIPASEARLDSSIAFKREYLEPGMEEDLAWAHLEARPLFFIYPDFAGISSTPGMKLVYESKWRKAYLYDPAQH